MSTGKTANLTSATKRDSNLRQVRSKNNSNSQVTYKEGLRKYFLKSKSVYSFKIK